MCFSCATAYQRLIAPYVVHGGCSLRAFSKMRARVVPEAQGVVAEIGFGSGLNLPHYDPLKIERLIAVDPDEKMLSIARRKLTRQNYAAELLLAGGEEIPVNSASVDTAVVTYAFCTIPAPERALSEIRRILKPGGRLLFSEHGRSDRSICSRTQDRLNGVWGQLAGGCNLNRVPRRLIEDAGFAINNFRCERFPLYLWPLGGHYSGEAVPR